VRESAYGVTPVIVELGNVIASISFNGLVTFQNLNGKVSTGGSASDINNNTTQILGGKIQTGTIDANSLYVGQYRSDGQQRTGDRIQITNSNIKVFSDTGYGTDVVRVIIGNLSA
jgi:hypothetical protein